MIVFNELRLDLESNSIVIDASVADNTYYSNIFIKSIKISTQEDYSDLVDGAEVYTETSGNSKRVRVTIPMSSLKELKVPLCGDSIKDNMFFVRITTVGTLGTGSPHKEKPKYIQGVTFSTESIYNTMMQFIKNIETEGAVSKDFIDYFMECEALRVSIDTGHYSTAIDIFNKYFKGKLGESLTTTTNCIYG